MGCYKAQQKPNNENEVCWSMEMSKPCRSVGPEDPVVSRRRCTHTFFLALPPALLAGSLSFVDFPASFFLSVLGGWGKGKVTKHTD